MKKRNKTKNKKGRFQYKAPSKKTVKQRQEAGGGNFDGIWKQGVKTFKPRDGANKIRLLPQTWNPGEADHFSYTVHFHRDIGPDNGQYLSLHKMKGKKDPIHEELIAAQRSGDDEYAQKLKLQERQVVFLIDRKADEPEPLAWILPMTVDRELAVRQVDQDTGEVIAIDDPYSGYDVTFTKTGKGLKTKYVGIEVARRSSPLLDDDDDVEEMLETLVENPLPECLEFKSYDYIAKQFGASGKDTDDDDDDDDDDDNVEEHDYSWEEIHDMDEDDLEEVIDDNDLDLDTDDYDDEDELADAVCEELDIEKPKKKKKKKKDKKSDRRKMRKMRER